MGKHSRTGEESGEDACLICGHESHPDGKCYHCGIFSDRLPAGHPCTRAFPGDDPDALVWAFLDGEENE